MKIKEFCELTKLSRKTAYYFYDKYCNKNHISKQHRIFTKKDVTLALSMKPENMMKSNRLKQIYENYYISPNGIVFYNHGGLLEIKKPYITAGYYYVKLAINNSYLSKRVSRLVAEAFLPNPQKYAVVNHKDGNKLNNNINNLEWCSISQNTKHAFDNGLAKNASGFDDSQSIPVIVCNKQFDFINVYGSISEASRVMSIRKSTITRHIKSEKIYKNTYYFFKLSLTTIA